VPAVQGQHLAHDGQAQAAALAAVHRVGGGEELVAQLRQRVVGHARPLVAQAPPHRLRVRPQVQRERRALGRVLAGVDQHVRERQRQLLGIALHGGRAALQPLQLQAALRQRGGMLGQHRLGQRQQVHGGQLTRAALAFQVRERQQTVHQLAQAVHLLADLAGEALAVGRGQLVLQQLRGALDGRQRAFELVGQRAHVLLQPLPALQALAHAVHGQCQLAQLAGQLGRAQCGAGVGQRVAHLLGVAAQLAHRVHGPQRHGHAHQQREAQQQRARAGDLALGPLHKGHHRGHGLAHRQHAQQALAPLHRCGDEHHRAAAIGLHLAGGAGAVLALERSRHVAPARIVLPHGGFGGGIEHHTARGVGDVDAEVQLALVQAPDLRVHLAVGVVAHLAGEVAAHQGAAGRHRGQVLGGQLGQQVGGVDHQVFHHLAHAGLEVIRSKRAGSRLSTLTFTKARPASRSGAARRASSYPFVVSPTRRTPGTPPSSPSKPPRPPLSRVTDMWDPHVGPIFLLQPPAKPSRAGCAVPPCRAVSSPISPLFFRLFEGFLQYYTSN